MCERRLDLTLDLEAREQRHRVSVMLELAQVVGHDLLDEFGGLFEGLLVVDQDLADVRRQVVAQCPDDRIALPVNQEGRLAFQHHVEDRVPDGEQILEIPGQFLGAAVDAGRPQDHAHAVGYLDFGERAPGEIALRADDAPGHTAGAGLVRLQDDEPAGEADEGGQRGALVAALLLVDLHNDVLAFFQDILDVGLAASLDGLDEVLAGDFLEREKTVALGAEVNERGFEAGLDARDLSFVDVGFFAFACR